MPKRLPERICIDTQGDREIKGFLTFVPQTKNGEHLKVKCYKLEEKSRCGKTSEAGE